MTTTVITTRYGRPALESLRAVVAEAKQDDPLAPLTVLVPSQAAGVVVRSHLARGIGAADCVAGLFLSTMDRR